MGVVRSGQWAAGRKECAPFPGWRAEGRLWDLCRCSSLLKEPRRLSAGDTADTSQEASIHLLLTLGKHAAWVRNNHVLCHTKVWGAVCYRLITSSDYYTFPFFAKALEKPVTPELKFLCWYDPNVKSSGKQLVHVIVMSLALWSEWISTPTIQHC